MTTAVTVAKWGVVIVMLICLFSLAMVVLLAVALAVKAVACRVRDLAAFWFRPVRAPHDEVKLTGAEAARWMVIVAGRRKAAPEPVYDNRSEP